MPLTQVMTCYTIILSVTHTDLFILCGDNVFKVFTLKCSGWCGFRHLASSVILNASQITNLCPFVHKVVSHNHASLEVIGNLLVYHTLSFQC